MLDVKCGSLDDKISSKTMHAGIRKLAVKRGGRPHSRNAGLETQFGKPR